MANANLRGLAAILIVSSFSLVGRAAVRHVPGDYAAIQSAINASTNGDVVLVSPGVYNENLNFNGKAITVSGTDAADPVVVSNTVIRAVGKRSTVSFVRGETSGSVLKGVTIAGGFGTPNTVFGDGGYWGGGIYCFRSSPTILGNIITANIAANGELNSYGYGCGIGCVESDAIITRNLITGNRGYAGGGIATHRGNARITDNLIISNSVAFGGGLLLDGGGQALNNTLVGNGAQFAGNVYASSDAFGQCLISNNIICIASSGGGVYLDIEDTFTEFAFNDVWNNAVADYLSGAVQTGLNGNISQDPQFVDATNGDYHLRDVSTCINAGDPSFLPPAGELDFYGSVRIYAGRVDIGASEYSDNFRPVAQAGPDQTYGATHLPALIALDGSASSDPNGVAVGYRWRKVLGPAGSFSDATAARPTFSASEVGPYVFELIVNNGSFDSFPDFVQVRVKNDAPIASAGPDQMLSDLQEISSVTLDGSRSFDPEGAVLAYRWKQVGGWNVALNDPNAAQPAFLRPWPGVYLFELVVNDGAQDSQPDVVAVVVSTNQAPVADAGPSRFVATGSITLDATRSYDPDGYGSLTYHWTQISGPVIAIAGAETSTPLVSGFTPRTTNQTCVFELVVSDGYLASPPSRVSVTIVKNFVTNALSLVNPPFDTAKPTILAFNGGNCTTGSGMRFGGVWEQKANWLTVDSYGPVYTRYGDMLMVYLSSVAPDYHQPIQVVGWSTGNLPALDVAWYVNTTYRDARYAINRVAMLDAVCSDLNFRVTPFNANRVAGEQAWVDNYISNDSRYSLASVIRGAVNVTCLPSRDHYYPVARYSSASLEYENRGLTAFAYLSVIGQGKNYQLNTSSNKYFFKIDSTEATTFFNSNLYPGKVLAPVQLTGPADGATMEASGATLGCDPVENAVRYQLLLGSTPDRVMDYAVISESVSPPSQHISTLAQEHAWWTVRAFDQFGSTIHADPKLLKLPENRPPVADAGPDLVAYAGLDGHATVQLDGSRSNDPDGDALNFTWAWASAAHAYLSNGISLRIDLPVGLNTVQLMVNDGHLNSTVDTVAITVVAPLECQVEIAPATINLRGREPSVLAAIRFPTGTSSADVDRSKPVLIYPGGSPAARTWSPDESSNSVNLFASFDKATLFGSAQSGPAELTVVGTLQNGQLFVGRVTVQIIEPGKPK